MKTVFSKKSLACETCWNKIDKKSITVFRELYCPINHEAVHKGAVTPCGVPTHNKQNVGAESCRKKTVKPVTGVCSQMPTPEMAKEERG